MRFHIGDTAKITGGSRVCPHYFSIGTVVKIVRSLGKGWWEVEGKIQGFRNYQEVSSKHMKPFGRRKKIK